MATTHCHPYIHSTTVVCDSVMSDHRDYNIGLNYVPITQYGSTVYYRDCHGWSSIIAIHKETKILQIIMWNIGMAKETRSGCLVHIVL